MSKAAELAALIGSQTALSNRNLIINGAMQVAQRGTVTGVTSAYGGPDRYQFSRSGAAAVSLSQDTTVPSNQGFTTSLKIDVTTADSSLAAGDYAMIRQRIEAQNLQHLLYGSSGAKTLTLQFWVKSPKAGTHICELYHDDATYFNSQVYSVASADTWQKVTLTFDGYQTTAFNNDNGIGLAIDWWLAAGSTYSGGTLSSNTWHNTQANRAVGQVNAVDDTSNNFYLTGVQLEVGEQATAFEHRSFADELARCQRYFYRISGHKQGAYSPCMIAYATSAAQGTLHLPTYMRAGPSLSISGAGFKLEDGGAGYTSTSTTFAGSKVDNGHANFWIGGFSGLVDGNAYYAYGSSSSHYMDLDAEL